MLKRIFVSPVQQTNQAFTRITFFLRDDNKQAVEFSAMYTLAAEGKDFPGVMPYQLCFHSSTPLFEGQQPETCWTSSEGCYFLREDMQLCTELTKILQEKGSEFVWPELEKIHRHMLTIKNKLLGE